MDYSELLLNELEFYAHKDDLFAYSSEKALALVCEIKRLQEYEKRLTDIEEFINEADPLKFVDATIKDGKITDAIVKGSFARIVVQSLVRLFIDSGSKNYLEIEMQKTMIDEKKPPEWYTLVIQKKGGMTPAQKAGMFEKHWDNCITILRDISRNHPLFEQSNNLYKEWCDYYDSLPVVKK